MEHPEAVSTLASERYLLGDMTDDERDAFEAHFFTCPVCADDVVAGDRMRQGVRDGLLRASTAVKQASRWTPSVILPWAAAASMALVAGYMGLRPSSQAGLSAPLALQPLTLRAATRGQDLVVTAAPNSVVTLAIDLGANRFEQGLMYTIVTDAGKTVGTGQAAAPAPGAPMLLVIPSSTFASPGRYQLTLTSTTNPSAPSAEYHFVVQR